MAQFDVYRLEGGLLVVDCQANSLSHLATRVVAPLMRSVDVPAPTKGLHPIFEFRGEPILLATHLLAAMPARNLGRSIGSLDADQYVIKNALDMLLSGV